MTKFRRLSIAEAKIAQEILERHYDTLYLYAIGLANRMHLVIYDGNDLMQQLFLKIAKHPIEYEKRRIGYFVRMLQTLAITNWDQKYRYSRHPKPP